MDSSLEKEKERSSLIRHSMNRVIKLWSLLYKLKLTGKARGISITNEYILKYSPRFKD